MASIRQQLRVDRFIGEYMIDGNGARAATAAGYAPSSAANQAAALLRDQAVLNEIERRRAIINAKVDLKVEDVTRAIVQVLRADTRELISYRRGACRYCHGAVHLYQYTPQEFRDAYTQFMETKEYRAGVPFNPQGGEGYNPKLEPHPDCPECFGDGEPYVFARDVRELSSDAAALYMGVKPNAHGTEMLIRSKDKAMELAARYLGMDKLNLLLGKTSAKDLTDDELAAIVAAELEKPGAQGNA